MKRERAIIMCDVVLASDADMDGIAALLESNHLSQGGMLSARFTSGQLSRIMQKMPIVVARYEGQIAGVLISSTPEMNRDIPVIQAMLQAYPLPPDAYIHGPICVDARHRGQGLSEKMMRVLRNRLKGRCAALFIRADNVPSKRAHENMGVSAVADFRHLGDLYTVYTYIA
jgi:GNAT superfamily N-acetyltransferase